MDKSEKCRIFAPIIHARGCSYFIKGKISNKKWT